MIKFSEKGELEIKIAQLKAETGLSDQEVKQLFIKTYLLEEEEKSTDEMMSDFLHDKDGEIEEL